MGGYEGLLLEQEWAMPSFVSARRKGGTCDFLGLGFSGPATHKNMRRIDFKVDYCLQSQRKVKYCFLFPNGWFIIFIV